MGMDLYVDTNVITNDEFEKFKNGEFYINNNDLTLLSKDEIEKTKKVFFFDFLSTIIENNSPEEVDEIFDTYRTTKAEKEEINLYNFLEEEFTSIMDNYIINKYRDNLYYDDEIFNCYINYNDWMEGNDAYDGYLYRNWIKVENSVVLIQSRFW